MRMYAVYQKSEALSYLSHLDIQRTLQRAFRRAGVPLAYSEGFNPHPQFSFAAAVPTGTASECEWFEVKLTEEMTPETFISRVSAALPAGLQVTKAQNVPDNAGKLTTLVRAARYEVRMAINGAVSLQTVSDTLSSLMQGEINVMKKTKGGDKMADIRPMIVSACVTGEDGRGDICLDVVGRLQTDGGLRVSHLTDSLLNRLDMGGCPVLINRKEMYFEKGLSLPEMPEETDGLHE